MKIINEKGMLFEKINVIDFLVIIFLLSLTPMFYYGYKLFYRQPDTQKGQNVAMEKEKFVETELNFVFKKIAPEVLSLISVGNKELGEDGEVMAEILSLGEVRPYNYEFNIGSSKKIIADPVLKDLPVTLRIKARIRQNNLYYKDSQISDNSVIYFLADKYKAEALYTPSLVVNNNRTEEIQSSIKIIEQKLRESESEESQLQNKINLLEGKINSLVDKIVSLETSLAAKGQKADKSERH